MLKNKFILFVMFLVLAFALLTYQSTHDESQAFSFTLYPLKILEQGSSAFMGIMRNYVLVWGKDEEKRKILQELNTCQQEKNRYKESASENDRLRDMLQFKTERPDYVTAADVFSRDPTNWFQVLWINKGIDLGIEKDMVAVTPFGIIGRIHRVLSGSANIILMTDANSSIAVRLESSRVEGILEGTGGSVCNLKYVSKDYEVAEGESIITSGLDGIYPEGLPAGYVTKVERDSEEVFQVIEVKPAQDLNKVEEVAILKR